MLRSRKWAWAFARCSGSRATNPGRCASSGRARLFMRGRETRAAQARACAARLRPAACALAERARLVGRRPASAPACDRARADLRCPRATTLDRRRTFALGGARPRPVALGRIPLDGLLFARPFRVAQQIGRSLAGFYGLRLLGEPSWVHTNSLHRITPVQGFAPMR